MNTGTMIEITGIPPEDESLLSADEEEDAAFPEPVAEEVSVQAMTNLLVQVIRLVRFVH